MKFAGKMIFSEMTNDNDRPVAGVIARLAVVCVCRIMMLVG